MGRIGIILVALLSPLLAESVDVPPALEPWKDWVLHDHPHISCPTVNVARTPTCSWVSRSRFVADDEGLAFSIAASMYAPGWLEVPGANALWPTDVRSQLGSLPVREQSGKPSVYLPEGEYTVSGFIPWPSVPVSVAVPKNSGIITLSLRDEEIERPEVDQNGQLWLGQPDEQRQTAERNTQKVQVFRLIKDGNPTKLETIVLLDIGGEPREIRTGQFLLENFIPLQLSSAIPVRIEKNGDLRAQVRPGRWEISLTARHSGPLHSLSYRTTNTLWPQTEVWSFSAQRSLRMVDIDGAPSIDPSQTDMPEAWKSYPAYFLAPERVLQISEIQRGDPLPESDDLTILRNFYLDFDGAGLTVSDKIRGTITQNTRLDSSEDLVLGSAQLNGIPQLITHALGDEETQGIEIRQRHIELNTVGRYEDNKKMFTVGWLQTFNEVRAVLHLPPGWSLLASQGVDKASHSWVSRWNLWDLFILLIIVVAVYRTCGGLAAVVAAFAMITIYHRTGAPLFIWLNIVSALALIKVTQGKLKTYVSYYQIVSFIALLLILLPFATDQIRQAFYPQLAKASLPHSQAPSQPYGMVSESRIQPEPAPEEMLSKPVESHDEEVYSVESLALRARPVSSQPSELGKSVSLDNEVDPEAVVQTGPSVPDWQWRTVSLGWNGPVVDSETLRFFLVPPWLNRLGNLLAVALSVLLAGLLLRRCQPYFSKWPLGNLVVLFMFFPAANFYSGKVDASVVIDQEILQQLEQRLTKPAECLPNCGSITRAVINAEDDNLSVLLTIDALDHIAFGLPAWRSTWVPEQVEVNGEPGVIKFGRGGQLLVRLTEGRHRIRLLGTANSQQVSLRFDMPVHNINAALNGWEVSGVRDGFSSSGNVRLQRTEQREEAEDILLPDPVPPFVIVSRRLKFGLQWSVQTQVQRVAPIRGAINMRIPLLEGESPLTDIQQDKDHVVVNFAANQQVMSWRSVLDKRDSIVLDAADGTSWSELWFADVSPIWHASYSGIPMIKNAQSNLPSWSPWPGERLTMVLQRPAAVAGNSLSIDSLTIDHKLGKRVNNTTLRFQARASQGQDFSFDLPEGAKLDFFEIDAAPQPLMLLSNDSSSNRVSVPLKPGQQNVVLRWHRDIGVDMLSTLPRLAFTESLNNIRMNMALPADRWVLVVGGPTMGPAVLLWGIFAVVFMLAFLLGRSGLTPLKTYQWLLLGIGVTSTNIYSPLIIVAWLLVMGLRGKMTLPEKEGVFHFLQVVLIFLSVLALFSLLSTIPMGLLSNPEMHVVGNGSNTFNLRWYQDYTDGLTPDAWVFSLPIYVYRIAMLLWSLWLAISLIDWVKWAWLQLNRGGFWRVDTTSQVLPQKTPQAQSEKNSNN